MEVDFSSLVSYLASSKITIEPTIGLPTTTFFESTADDDISRRLGSFTSSASVSSASRVSHVAFTESQMTTGAPTTSAIGAYVSGDRPESQPAASQASSGLSSFSIAAIVGTVFGGVGVSGFVLGILVWRCRKKRATENERNEGED